VRLLGAEGPIGFLTAIGYTAGLGWMRPAGEPVAIRPPEPTIS
jgi:hypothetical protein